jgi:hypothetical protein
MPLGQFLTGSTGKALATSGALYAYGVLLSGAFRVARIESSGTEISVRGQLFVVQGGGRFSLIPFVSQARSDPEAIPSLVVNFGDLLITPASWYGWAASVNVAQAVSSMFSLQASFKLNVQRFRQSPFVPGRGRVDIDATGWLPQVGVAFGVNPPDFPVAFLARIPDRRAGRRRPDVARPPSVGPRRLLRGEIRLAARTGHLR